MKKLLLLTMLLTVGMNAVALVTVKSGTGTCTSKVVSSKTGQTKKSVTASNSNQSATINGNTAILNLICQMGDENGKVTVKLTYNPKNRSITVSNAKLIDCSMCILDGIDPITLYKKI